MERRVYCPSQVDLAQAELLAKSCKLPILIGDSESTQNLSFDRSQVQIIQIPIFNYFIFNDFNIKLGFHQNFIYVNEFFELINNVSLFINDDEIKPAYQEKHKIKFSYCCNNYGNHFGKIFLNKELVEEFEFNVN